MKELDIRILKVENGYEVSTSVAREGWKQKLVFGVFISKEWIAKDSEQLAKLLKEIINSVGI
jgi:hypothetical protein